MLTTLIYQRLNGFGPEAAGQVAVLAMLLTLIAVAALLMRAVLMRKLKLPVASGVPLQAGRNAPIWLQAAIWAVVLFIGVLPLVALALTSVLPAIGVRFSWDAVSLAQYQAVLGNDAVLRAFANSLVFSLVCAAFACWLRCPMPIWRRIVRGGCWRWRTC